MRARRPLLPVVGLLLVLGAPLGCDADDAAPSDTVSDASPPDTSPPPDTVDPSPGLGIDYGATAPGATPRLEPGATDWLAVGWPSDRFRKADGRLDLSALRFPGAPGLLETYLDLGEDVLDGFGLNGAIYFQLDESLDPGTLPGPALTRSPTSPVQLVNVSPGSAREGERLPLLFHWYESGTDRFYRPRTLALRPVYGFPLAEGETYCAILTRAIQDAEGRYLQAAPALGDALDTDATLAPLTAWLPRSPLRREDLATATCFTTQRATAELRAVSAWIDAHEPPAVDQVYEPGVWNEFHGTYIAPNFQAGVKPYEADGDIRFTPSGDPIVQDEELIRFMLMVPRHQEMPPAGWPLVLYSHGTGGDYETCFRTANRLLPEGLAVLCIDQPLHGLRGPDLADGELELFSFNFINPYSGRSSFRQAAIDSLLLSRMAAAGRFDIPGADTVLGEDVRFDPDLLLFFGHSHGGLSGALAFAVDPRLRGGVLSGAAGVLVETILRRKDPADIAFLVRTLIGIAERDLDTFHPMMTLVQTLVDATDPINYAPYWLNTRAGGVPKHVLVTEGTLDHASPAVGTEAMAAAAGLPILAPLSKASPAHELRGLPVLAAPLAGNIARGGAPLTGALRQWQHGNHWVGENHPEAQALWRHFLRTFAAAPPELAYGDVHLPIGDAISGADTCHEARALNATAFPHEVRGNTSAAADAHQSGGACGDPLGDGGRDLVYRFDPPAAGAYRFRIVLPPAVNQQTPRHGPNLLYAATSCGLGAACLDQRLGGALDLDLDAGVPIYLFVDGTTWLDKGPFTLRIEQLCAQLACGDRECGAWGCGECGACPVGQRCAAEGRCAPLPPGDSCADPIAVSALPFAHAGDSTHHTNTLALDHGACEDLPFNFGFGSADVVYRFTAPAAGVYRADLGPNYDGVLYAARDCDAVASTCLGANRALYGESHLALALAAGETVYLVVDGASNVADNAGPYTFTLETCVPRCEGRSCGDDGCGGSCGACELADSCVSETVCPLFNEVCDRLTACEAIPGNTCASAFEVDALPFTDTRHTGDFEPEYGFGHGWCPGVDGGFGFGASDVAYRLVAPTAGLYHVRLDTGTPRTLDASLYVVRDCDAIRQTCLGADERAHHERLWLELAAGEEVFVIVDGWTNFTPQVGRYTLEITHCEPTCEERVCGSDGCLGSCGACGFQESCSQGRCVEAFGLHCGQPRNVGQLPWAQSSSTSGFQDRSVNACDGAATGGASNDVTYRFRAPKAGHFTFRLEASFDAQLYVTSTCEEVVSVCLASGGLEHVVELAHNQQVFVIVDGAPEAPEADEGAFTLRVSETCFPQCDGRACGPDGCGGSCGSCAYPADGCSATGACVDPYALVGNTCALAFEVGPLPFEGVGDTREAFNHYAVDAAWCGDLFRKGFGSPDQVWSFTPVRAGRYRVTVAPEGGWDAALYVLEDCRDPAGACLAGADGHAEDVVELDLAFAQTVFLIVDGDHDVVPEGGKYRIHVEEAP